MRNQLSILLLLFLCFSAQAAFAQEQCPVGYVSFINTKTYESVCLPVDAMSQPVIDKPEADKPEADQDILTGDAQDAGAEDADGYEDGEEAGDELIWGNGNIAEPYGGYVEPSQNNVPQEVVTQLSESQLIHQGVMRPGWSVQFGLGYGMVDAIDIQLVTGYHFTTGDDVASFGLYLDLDFRPGNSIDFSMDATVKPTLHVSKGNFRFSLALGLGIFALVDESWSEWDGHETAKTIAFALKPGLAFDWFLSENAFMGFSFSVPLIIGSEYFTDMSVMPWFSLDLHLGYRF
ncbi:MAG: hypothetical protein IJ268_01980 [Proteobacteria bacterium]|nr:hypothetical protein [Pseudomonadota bacterium]